MKKILDFIKKYWAKFIKLTRTKNFVFTFPLAVLALIAFITKSLLVVFLFVVWVIVIIANTDEEW
jgi:hypothetical protein